MRFDDEGYLERYYLCHQYPKIHDDIFHMHRYFAGKRVIDLGSCTGLLSDRLASVYELVVGIEPLKRYIDQAIKNSKVIYENFAINESTIDRLRTVVKKYGIDTIYARRVFPEIYDTGGYSLLNKILEVFVDCGVEYIVIEGRKSNRNAVNPLYDVKKEIAVFNEYYEVIESYKNCRLLKRR